GIDPSHDTCHLEPDSPPDLAFLGRISPEKGPQLAIEIAKRSGWKLKIAGKVDPIDREFFETQIKPLCDGQQIEYLGEAKHEDKSVLLGGAFATLFPITWREPFGLVMVESMVVGTPVIAINLGSVSEVIAHGKTGYICNTVDECIAALEKVPNLSRDACHQYVVEKFSAERMTTSYEEVYQQVMAEKYTQNGYAHQIAGVF
ncbi:MAG: glycosyltransferase, partial [Snowella sp.]